MAELTLQLLQLQRDFAAALRDASSTQAIAARLNSDQETAQRRLAVYRGNAVANAQKALAAAYPIIEQIVGAEFFAALARAYWQEQPSTSGDLHDYGGQFCQFLVEFPHVQDLPYLADLARLEWAAHRAYLASDAPSFDVAAFALVHPNDYEKLYFQLAAGTAVIPSQYPIVQIWTIHQAAHQDDFTVDWEQAQIAHVSRAGLKVRVSEVTLGAATWLENILRARSFAQALEAAIQIEPSLNVNTLLTQGIRDRWLCGFSVL